jgi:cobalt-zinc-cadmium efflux system outer membrane protein
MAGAAFLLYWLAALHPRALGASPPAPPEQVTPAAFSLDEAVAWALQNNPELAALRQQHGIAAAAVVIAQTYPFNPVLESKVRATNGPTSAGITNRLSQEYKLLGDVEIRGQGTFRRREAFAALSRTDWEIAYQEQLLAVRTIRAFDTVLYRRAKLRLIEDIIRLNEEAAGNVRKLQKRALLGAADLILVDTEVLDARAQRSSAGTVYVTALNDLRRALGLVDQNLEPVGTLEIPTQVWDRASLVQLAFERRADLQARRVAVNEAEARVCLAIANRYGNPNVGPAYEYDPTRINLIGAQLTLPIPVFNTHEGDILQRKAERSRAALDLRQTETLVQQDIQAALDRVRNARGWASTYRTEVLPKLESSLKDMEGLLVRGAPGVDVLRVLDILRKLLHARDIELDALWEVSQAQADLAAAVGDPAMAIVAHDSPQKPNPVPAPKQ